MRLDTLRNSPITRTELFYQQHRQPKRRGWLIPLFYRLLIGLAAFNFIVGFLGISAWAGNLSFAHPVVMVFYVLVLVQHFRLMLRTLHLSSAAITRDKRDSERWEALLLTGVSGREIVLGKWWATIKTQWKEYLFLVLLRASIVVTFTNVGQGMSYSYGVYTGSTFSQTNIMMVTLGMSIVALLTLASLPYTAACGVMSAMETKRGSGVVRGFAARAAFTTLASLLPLLAWAFLGYGFMRNLGFITYEQHSLISIVISQFSSILLDNGLIVGADIAANTYWMQSNLFVVLVACALVLATYGVLTRALLWFAQWRAQRAGALHPQEVLPPTTTKS